MNKVILMGRLTRDPEVRYSQGEQATAIARYTIAVDRRFRRDNDQQTADFIPCVAFGRLGRVCREISPQRNKGSRNRTYPDRQLYQQGRTAGIHNRYRCGRV